MRLNACRDTLPESIESIAAEIFQQSFKNFVLQVRTVVVGKNGNKEIKRGQPSKPQMLASRTASSILSTFSLSLMALKRL